MGFVYNLIYRILLLTFLFPLSVSAQNNPACDYCGKKITGRYIQAEGNTFHPDHFICVKCNKKISGSFAVKDDDFYHPNCFSLTEGLVCGYCKKIIDDEYIISSDKKYHQDCYENHVVPKCVICTKPLVEEYSEDAYGNVFHSFHNDELYRCDNCSRLISKSITKDGREYSDGRHICNLCYADAVFDAVKYKSILKKVIAKLKTFGLNYNDENIVIKPVDRIGLRHAVGSNYNKNTRGFCQSEEVRQYIDKKQIKKMIRHTIYVLNGIPSINIEAIIAHELTHAWLVENTKNDHSGALREGSCNFIAYLYLNSVRNHQAEKIIKSMEYNDDPVYGKGFVKVRSQFENQHLSSLLGYLKTKKNI